MKMILARLKILTLKVIIILFLMTMALIGLRHGCMGSGFIQRIMVFLAMK